MIVLEHPQTTTYVCSYAALGVLIRSINDGPIQKVCHLAYLLAIIKSTLGIRGQSGTDKVNAALPELPIKLVILRHWDRHAGKVIVVVWNRLRVTVSATGYGVPSFIRYRRRLRDIVSNELTELHDHDVEMGMWTVSVWE